MWKSVALVAGLGGMFGAILAVAGRKLAVHTDPRIEAASIICRLPIIKLNFLKFGFFIVITILIHP